MKSYTEKSLDSKPFIGLGVQAYFLQSFTLLINMI